MPDFQETINKIAQSDIYENSNNWLDRGLNQSDSSVIKLLRSSTNDFLKKLDDIFNDIDSEENKLQKINQIVDDLPWLDLDTEEKEFLADTLAPAIKASGFNPWAIF